jgi:hypothetical protein
VLPEVHAALEGARFPDGGEVEFLGRGGQEDGYVVAENTGEDLTCVSFVYVLDEGAKGGLP